jgi:hypothetical protein
MPRGSCVPLKEPIEERVGEKAMASARPFDTAEYLDKTEMIDAYLAEALESGDPSAINMAIEATARARIGGKRNESPDYRKSDLG